MYFWFVANHRWGRKGRGNKIAQFVSNLVVTRDDETAYFALKSSSMSNAELLVAAITV
jgi:hypothetical protein